MRGRHSDQGLDLRRLRGAIVVCGIVLLLLVPGVFCLLRGAEATVCWWANKESVAGYRLYYGRGEEVEPTMVDVGNVQTYTFKGLAPGPVVWVYLTAYGKFGLESRPSKTLKFWLREPLALAGVSFDTSPFVHFEIRGVRSGTVVVLEASEDLENWEVLTTVNEAFEGRFDFYYMDLAQYYGAKKRFYRLRIL